MRLLALASLAGVAAVANAHFQLQFPLPRGPFVEDDEPKFCDGFGNVTTNRTSFPLSGGVINLNSEHAKWTAGVLVSTVQNPTSFDNFSSSGNQQLGVPFFQQDGEGKYCFPVNLASSGISGVKDGANITIQIVFDGGDGKLYQCADLALSNSATIPATATSGCKNVTNPPSPSSSASATASSGSQPKPSTGAAVQHTLKISSAVAGFAVAVLLAL